MSLTGLLTQRCTIQRWARTVDDYGEMTPSWANSDTDVPCLIQQKNALFFGKTASSASLFCKLA